MKIIAVCLLLFVAVSFAGAKENAYTGSTPANAVVRLFLGIPLQDSVDFIRWQLVLKDKNYTLNCNYGIGKPNTNGFINGGKKTVINGVLHKEKNYYYLQYGTKKLKLVEINTDLLHFLDEQDHLLVGNSGWSYTLNNLTPSVIDEISITAQQTDFKDSIAFEGRTPCGVPGIISAGMQCYKLKWYIILYSDATKKGTGTYKVYGTPYRKLGARTGNWKIITGRNKQIIYRFNDDKGNGLLHLLKLDENIFVFTDANGKLLVGDEDFSYTLNRINKTKEKQ